MTDKTPDNKTDKFAGLTGKAKRNAVGANNLRKSSGRLKGNPEEARRIAAIGLESKRSRKEEIQNALNVSKNMTKDFGKQVKEIDTFSILKTIALQKFEKGDLDGASRILKDIAEFEKPKLTRSEVKQQIVNYEGMTIEDMKTLQVIGQALDMQEVGVDTSEYLIKKGFQKLADKSKDELIEAAEVLQKKVTSG